jgi:ribonuclease G
VKMHILSCAKNIFVTEGSMAGANRFEIRAVSSKQDLEERIKRTEEGIKNKPIIRLLVNHD